MAKRKFNVGSIMVLAAAVLALIAFFMSFAPSIAMKEIAGHDTGVTYSGWNVAFGKSENDVAILNFSFGNFLTYLLVLAGVVLCIVCLLGKGGKVLPFIVGGVLVLAGILFFCALAMTAPNVGKLTGDLADSAIKSFKDGYNLGAGAIVGGIFSLISGALMVVKSVIKK